MIARRRSSFTGRARSTAVSVAVAGAIAIGFAQPPAQTPPASQASAAAQASFNEGKRLYDRSQYDQALPFLDTIIATLAPQAATLSEADRDLLAETYKLRARARFNESLPGVEDDFAAMFAIRPSAVAGDMSAKTEQVFNKVKKNLVGQLRITMSPAINAAIDGRPYSADQLSRQMDLIAGEHTLTATRMGYKPLSQPFTVVAGQMNAVDATMERSSATVSITTIPDGVQVIMDDVPRGVTQKGDTPGGPSQPIIVGDLALGDHAIVLKRDCYVQWGPRTIKVDRFDDLEVKPQQLEPAVATATVDASGETGAMIFLDGVQRSPAPAEVNNICEGLHVLEVRSPRGRSIDRRTWRAGEKATIKAELRPSFAIVSASVAGAVSPAAFKTSVENALRDARRLLVYAPADSDLEKALTEERTPSDWLGAEIGGRGAARAMTRETRRDIGRKLATRLSAQGVAAITTNDGDHVTLTLLAAGSGEPDTLTFNLRDPASYKEVSTVLGGAPPLLVKPTLETSVVDVAGVQGAAVVRANGAGSRAGLVPGDVIVGLGTAPIASVGELRTKMMSIQSAAPLNLQVKTMAGASKAVTLTPVLAPDTLPMRDPLLIYNRLLIDLQEAARTAKAPVDEASARLNLGIVHMRLGNWDEAIRELMQVKLQDGPGVSAGTVNYLLGVSYEAAGRMTDAQGAFTKAAASEQARLREDGPLVAPLAQQRLRTLRP
jgi:tetratricopeptide (TPR) repeat protein